MSFEGPPSGARRLFDIAEALCRAVGNAIRPGFIDAVLAMIVVRRIMRVRGLLLAIEARFLAGVVLRSPRAAGAAAVGVTARAAGPAAVRLPRGFAWLCPLVPSYAATYAQHLRILLAEPEMVALLAACPQAVRVLRPLCWMVGIAQAEWVPGATPAVARVVRAKRVRVSLPAVAKRCRDFTFVPYRFRAKIV